MSSVEEKTLFRSLIGGLDKHLAVELTKAWSEGRSPSRSFSVTAPDISETYRSMLRLVREEEKQKEARKESGTGDEVELTGGLPNEIFKLEPSAHDIDFKQVARGGLYYLDLTLRFITDEESGLTTTEAKREARRIYDTLVAFYEYEGRKAEGA